MNINSVCGSLKRTSSSEADPITDPIDDSTDDMITDTIVDLIDDMIRMAQFANCSKNTNSI